MYYKVCKLQRRYVSRGWVECGDWVGWGGRGGSQLYIFSRYIWIVWIPPFKLGSLNDIILLEWFKRFKGHTKSGVWERYWLTRENNRGAQIISDLAQGGVGFNNWEKRGFGFVFLSNFVLGNSVQKTVSKHKLCDIIILLRHNFMLVNQLTMIRILGDISQSYRSSRLSVSLSVHRTTTLPL